MDAQDGLRAHPGLSPLARGHPAITLAADQINIDGTTTFASGYDPSDGRVTIRQTGAPSLRPSGDPLQDGDMWIDTNDGDRPYSYNGSSWIAALTVIDGGNITTGTIDAARITVGSATDYEAGYNPRRGADVQRQNSAPATRSDAGGG